MYCNFKLLNVKFAWSRRIYRTDIKLVLWRWLFYGNAAYFAKHATRIGKSAKPIISMRLLRCLVGEVLFHILWKELLSALANLANLTIIIALSADRVHCGKYHMMKGGLFMNSITIITTITTSRAAVVIIEVLRSFTLRSKAVWCCMDNYYSNLKIYKASPKSRRLTVLSIKKLQ